MAKKTLTSPRTSPQKRSQMPVVRKHFPWYLLLMPAIVAFWGFFYFEKGEIIALNNGCGWDGVTYKNVVWSLQWNKSSPEYRERGRLHIDPYRAQRIAPSVAVYGEMQAAKYLYQHVVPMFGRTPSWLEWSYEQYPLPPWFFRWFAKSDAGEQQSVALTIDSFVAGYFVFHSLFMLIGTAAFWGLIARKLELGAAARWLGFTALFVNFAVMKMSFYYPTLTDTSALFVATVILYAYLANSPWLLLPAAAVGFFTFPTAFYVAMILFIFPRTHLNIETPETTLVNKRSARLIAVGTTLGVLLLSVYLVLVAQTRFPEVEPVYWVLLPLTMPLMLAQFFFTVENIVLVFPAQSFMRYLRSRQGIIRYGVRIGIGLCLWGVLYYCKMHIEDPALSAPMNTNLFLGGSFACAVSKPLLTIVALVVYFGPSVLLVALHFRSFLRTAWQIGSGYFFVIAAMLLLATIMTETRQLINFLPFIVVGVASMLNAAPVRTVAVVVFSLMSIMGSKIWLPLNFPGMQEQAANIQNGSFATFPLQYYFMNHGPWMSATSYLIQGVVVLMCCGLLLWTFPSAPVQERTEM